MNGYGVSTLVARPPVPSGNADTITNSLAPFANASVKAAVYAAASTGNIPDYNEPSCSGVAQGDYTEAIAGTALSAVPFVGKLLSTVFGVFGAHHAAAVKLEQSTLCREVPGIQSLLSAIDQAVQQGADPQAAGQALENGYSTFVSRTQGIFKNCNAACDYRKYVRAAIEFRKQNFALMAQSYAPTQSQSAIGGVVNAVSTAFAPPPFAGLPPVTQSLLTASPSPSYSGALAQAGLTPGRQISLAGALLVGGLLVSVLVLSNLFGGKK